MKRSLHRLDIVALIQARGWLKGEVERLRSSPASTEESIEIQTALFLEKNEGTILTRATTMGDPDYVEKVAEALPQMLREIYSLIDKMRRSEDPVVLEAAALLGGEPGGNRKGGARKGNVSSVINRAIASGDLADYIRAVGDQFAQGEMLKQLYAAIEKFGEGTEASEALAKNKGSIISHALHHGRLDYVATVVAAFEGEDGFLPRLNREIERLKNRGETEAADALAKNKGSIINHALHHGRLDYVAAVVAAFEGENGFLRRLNRAAEELRKSGHGDQADSLLKRRGSIVHDAIMDGSFGPSDREAFGEWVCFYFPPI